MPKPPRREIAVFIASPGDLAPERQAFRATIDTLNGGFGDGAGVQFEALGWENVLATTGRRAQGVINEEVDRCDVFILVLHRRWGQAAPDSTATSYTEEEFERALERFKRTEKPEIMIFFKNVDAAAQADAGPELSKVIDFRKKLEAGRDTLYRPFNGEGDFAREVDLHLRAFARNDGSAAQRQPPALDISAAPLGPPQADQSLVKAQLGEVAMTRAAVDAARSGRMHEAGLLFAKATEATTDTGVLAVAIEFFTRSGDPDSANGLIARHAALTQDRELAARLYIGMLPQGIVHAQQRQAVEMLVGGMEAATAQEIREVFDEVFEPERELRRQYDMLVKHFTAAELLAMARQLSSAEGQSALLKQAQFAQENMDYGAREFQRVYERRQAARTAPPTLEG